MITRKVESVAIEVNKKIISASSISDAKEKLQRMRTSGWIRVHWNTGVTTYSQFNPRND